VDIGAGAAAVADAVASTGAAAEAAAVASGADAWARAIVGMTTSTQRASEAITLAERTRDG